ncbi:hypothetical protein NKG94_20900 [Micromonospora sp. M12]
MASMVRHHTPMSVPSRSNGSSWETSRTIDSTVVPAKLFLAWSTRHAERSTGEPFLTAPLMVASSSRSTKKGR